VQIKHWGPIVNNIINTYSQIRYLIGRHLRLHQRRHTSFKVRCIIKHKSLCEAVNVYRIVQNKVLKFTSVLNTIFLLPGIKKHGLYIDFYIYIYLFISYRKYYELSTSWILLSPEQQYFMWAHFHLIHLSSFQETRVVSFQVNSQVLHPEPFPENEMVFILNLQTSWNHKTEEEFCLLGYNAE
jgi:hypothetical protein